MNNKQIKHKFIDIKILKKKQINKYYLINMIFQPL